jgi:DNA helicase II / ATP-dependent DNA helicase PcrA
LLDSIDNYEKLHPEAKIADYLAEISLLTSADETTGNIGISLMTLHNAKGTEFENVFVVGVEEGLLPHFSSFSDLEELEEELRLLYVGITRAKNTLHLSSCAIRRVNGQIETCMPSRFIASCGSQVMNTSLPPVMQKVKTNILTKNQDFESGNWVIHPTFGRGQIISREGWGNDIKISIRFADGQIKRIATKFVQLENF